MERRVASSLQLSLDPSPLPPVSSLATPTGSVVLPVTSGAEDEACLIQVSRIERAASEPNTTHTHEMQLTHT